MAELNVLEDKPKNEQIRAYFVELGIVLLKELAPSYAKIKVTGEKFYGSGIISEEYKQAYPEYKQVYTTFLRCLEKTTDISDRILKISKDPDFIFMGDFSKQLELFKTTVSDVKEKMPYMLEYLLKPGVKINISLDEKARELVTSMLRQFSIRLTTEYTRIEPKLQEYKPSTPSSQPANSSETPTLEHRVEELHVSGEIPVIRDYESESQITDVVVGKDKIKLTTEQTFQVHQPTSLPKTLVERLRTEPIPEPKPEQPITPPDLSDFGATRVIDLGAPPEVTISEEKKEKSEEGILKGSGWHDPSFYKPSNEENQQ